MTITLSELKTQSRHRADMENSEFVSDSELTSYINSSVSELHDILTQAYSSDYNIDLYEFTTTNDQEDYDLPSDFYKVRGVDAQLNGSDWFTLTTFNFNERNRFEKFGAWSLLGIASVRYRVVGDKLRFSTIPDKQTSLRLWYVPVATELVDNTDTLNNYNGYHEYIIVDVAIKMLMKEESDVTMLSQKKMELKRRIEEAANNRDVGSSESVQDVYAENEDSNFGRTRG